ncbi:hypothetical protein AB0N09_35770 [Streptomyces erythrochromogenes]|uniref:hypothetical protein n=1 Tax=Streptomyces erythrochromogenes TaxID=285574 RepID=UPI003426793F
MATRHPRLYALHADGTECPRSGPGAHRYTVSGKPLTAGCPGRTCWVAECRCGWSITASLKVAADEPRKRHSCPRPPA